MSFLSKILGGMEKPIQDQDLMSFVTAIKDKKTVRAIAYALTCEASMQTEETLKSGVRIPEDLDNFTDAYPKPVDENGLLGDLSKFDIEYHDENTKALAEFRRIRNKMSNPRQRQLSSYETIRKIVTFSETL